MSPFAGCLLCRAAGRRTGKEVTFLTFYKSLFFPNYERSIVGKLER